MHTQTFIPVGSIKQLVSVDEETFRIEQTHDFGSVGPQCFLLTDSPLHFDGVQRGIRRFDGKYAYLVIASNDQRWLDVADKSIITEAYSGETLHRSQRGIDRPVLQATYLDIEEAVSYLEKTPDRSFVIEQTVDSVESAVSDLLSSMTNGRKAVAVFSPFKQSKLAHNLKAHINLSRLVPFPIFDVQNRNQDDSELRNASIVLVPDWLEDDDFQGKQSLFLKELCVSIGVNYQTSKIHRLTGDAKNGDVFLIQKKRGG